MLTKEQLPTPIGDLDLFSADDTTTQTPIKVHIGHNLGNRSFLAMLPMHEFFKLSDVANVRGKDGSPVAQRKLDPVHAKKLAIYILKGLVTAAIEWRTRKNQDISKKFAEILEQLGKQPYMSLQPIVTNIRECDSRGTNIPGVRLVTGEQETAGFKILLSQSHILWVIDGQHRRKGMEMVFDFLNYVRDNHKYPTKKNSLVDFGQGQEIAPAELQVWSEAYTVARSFCTIAVEIHLGLNVDEERQLFHDLNNLSKKVEASLALEFDNSNPVNLFIKEELINQIINWEVVERDVVDWHEDTGEISRRQLVAICARLLLNKNNISGATPLEIEDRKPVAKRFWEQVNEIPYLGEPESKLKTVAAQPVMLKALAKLIFDFAFSKRHKDDAALEKLLSNIPLLDYSHENPMWRYYTFTDTERQDHGIQSLGSYLPVDEQGVNRDIGGYDKVNNTMRFGAKHNDIFPILADMIRWQLALPNRHDKEDN